MKLVRKAETRKRRYEASLHAERIGAKFGAQKPIMTELEGEYLGQIALVESKVKSIVEAAGVPSYLVAQYINVGRQCYSIARRFSQATRDAEAQHVVDHWASRGLNGTLLAQVCLAGGCEVAAPTEGWAPATKQFSLSPCGYGGGASVVDEGIQLNGEDERVSYCFTVPHDFHSLLEAYVVCRPRATAAGVNVDLYSWYARCSALFSQHSEAETTILYNFTDNTLYCLDVSVVLTGIQVGDQVMARVTQRDVFNLWCRHLNVRYE